MTKKQNITNTNEYVVKIAGLISILFFIILFGVIIFISSKLPNISDITITNLVLLFGMFMFIVADVFISILVYYYFGGGLDE